MDPDKLTDVIKTAANSSEPIKEDERLYLLAACEKLKARLENPREALLRIVLAVLLPITLRERISADVGTREISLFQQLYYGLRSMLSYLMR